MAKGKLILICQSGGKLVTKEDESVAYDGGEANAIAINPDTQYDDLKLKLAELCNVEYNSVSIKYFIPGNKRTLIALSNDKDLKRMYEFHGDSVTADVVVMGTAGFNREAVAKQTGRYSSPPLLSVLVYLSKFSCLLGFSEIDWHDKLFSLMFFFS